MHDFKFEGDHGGSKEQMNLEIGEEPFIKMIKYQILNWRIKVI